MAELIAYDTDGNIIATLGHMVARDDAGEVIGLVDFEGHELAGGALTDIWVVSHAAGSGTWPEHLSARAHDFRVERDPATKRITSLVHKKSGYRRERAAIEAAIAAAPALRNNAGHVIGKDVRRIVGGPARPLAIGDDGRDLPPDHPEAPTGTPKHLPVVGATLTS